jgi:hypothetical protein
MLKGCMISHERVERKSRGELTLDIWLRDEAMLEGGKCYERDPGPHAKEESRGS